jgi:hypothetical protein
MFPARQVLFAVLAVACVQVAHAANPEAPSIALHAQATWIRQFKPAFGAAYTGPNSLVPQREWSYSFTTTADLGIGLWRGAQVHLNPEGAQGVPLSNLTGAGGLSNGELQRGSATSLRSYRARLFFQQRIDVGGDAERIEPDFNEIGGTAAQRRWTITAGTISLLDYFDPNPYAKDPREQFVNWALLTHGAWDYAADARGYTTGAMAEYRGGGWALRFGRFMQPRESNGLQLESNLRRLYGDQVEVDAELPLRLAAGPLRGRVLLFRNRIDGGAYTDALTAAGGGVPDVSAVRRVQSKQGWGVTLEAPLGDGAGVFVRASRNDGRVEPYAFTSIDRQVAIGSQFTGARWGRAADRWGVAYAVNGLSPAHRTYLARGGQDFFLGDGRLSYAPERILEAYYRWTFPDVKVGPARLHNAVSGGFQHMANPAYNRDRGPVRTWTVRWHTEF